MIHTEQQFRSQQEPRCHTPEQCEPSQLSQSQGTLGPTSAGHSELAPVTLASLAATALLTCPQAGAPQGLSDGKGEGSEQGYGKGRDLGRKHRMTQGVGRLRTRWKAGNPHETF